MVRMAGSGPTCLQTERGNSAGPEMVEHKLAAPDCREILEPLRGDRVICKVFRNIQKWIQGVVLPV